MKVSRVVRGAVALALLLGLVPMGAAQAAVNKPPRIKKAELKDKDGDGLADRIVLTYNERINHKLDTARFPFRVDGYKILKVNGARRSLRLTILLKESQSAPLKPAFVKYSRTRKQPVKDLKKKQAAKQLLNRNIVGLTAPPPPPEETFTLTVAKGGDGLGTVTDNASKINCGTTCTAEYAKGSSVTLTATPDAATKATFASWTGCTSTTSTCTVTMDADKSVTATFSKAGTFALAVTRAGAGAADGTVTSTSNPTQASQINCGTTCTASYPKDTVVTLTATVTQGSGATFAGFSGGGCPAIGTTCNVTMTAAQNVTATFNKLGSFVLTVTKAGSGTGTVTSTSNPAQTNQINCGSTCTASYPSQTQVTLTATPDASMSFAGFSGGGCTGTSTTCIVTIDAAKTVTATFNSATLRQLTLTKEGMGDGTVTSTSSPAQTAQINCGATCQVNFPNNATVTLTASPDENSDFAGWSGEGCTGTSPTCNLPMDANKGVTATFSPKLPLGTRQLTFLPTNGVGTCSPLATGGDGVCNGTYADGTPVVITAIPGDGMNPLSAVWTGCDAPAVALTCTVTMTADKTVTVTFTALGGLPDVGGGLSIK